MKLIDKNTLVEKIDNILDYADEHWDTEYVKGARWFTDKLQDAIDTLEVKEIDLEEELYVYTVENFLSLTGDKEIPYVVEQDDMLKVAKYFFELGLKAQKGE